MACSSDAENSESKGTAITLDIPSLTALTCSSNSWMRYFSANLTYSLRFSGVILVNLNGTLGHNLIISHTVKHKFVPCRQGNLMSFGRWRREGKLHSREDLRVVLYISDVQQPGNVVAIDFGKIGWTKYLPAKLPPYRFGQTVETQYSITKPIPRYRKPILTSNSTVIPFAQRFPSALPRT